MPEKTAFLVTTDTIGEGGGLGRILMKGFLATLAQAGHPPERMIFLNRGVQLTTEDEECAEALGALEQLGVELLSCGTCLDYFGLKDRLRIGRATTMRDTVAALCEGFRVVTIA